MTISELVGALQEMQYKHGDVDVVIAKDVSKEGVAVYFDVVNKYVRHGPKDPNRPQEITKHVCLVVERAKW